VAKLRGVGNVFFFSNPSVNNYFPSHPSMLPLLPREDAITTTLTCFTAGKQFFINAILVTL
jgi:hypothetical protein